MTGPTNEQALDTERCDILKLAVNQNLLNHETPSAMFFDLDYFEKTLNQFKNAFSKPDMRYLHCFAAKACPFPDVIRRLPQLGFGLEAASLTEVELALRNGIEPKNIVWDSPCKTFEELKYGISMGINMNADNVQELSRIQEIVGNVRNLGCMSESSPQFLGLRVNPCVGFGDRQITSTADLYSKFGLPLSEYESEIIGYFKSYPWLNTIHSHIGSQAFGIADLADAIRIIYELAEKINSELGFQQVLSLNMGGGLPTLYDHDNPNDHFSVFEDFVENLGQAVPEIFSGKYLLMTENGRTLITKSGWTVSRIEYTKQIRDRLIVTQHVGADMLMRTCYLPTVWPLRKFICDKTGKMKIESEECRKVICDVAGPLCFGGDYIGKGETMPMPTPGDWLIICDTGGYTIGMWSRHCSRPCPPVYSFRRPSSDSMSRETAAKQVQFELMKKKETVEQIISFYT